MGCGEKVQEEKIEHLSIHVIQVKLPIKVHQRCWLLSKMKLALTVSLIQAKIRNYIHHPSILPKEGSSMILPDLPHGYLYSLGTTTFV